MGKLPELLWNRCAPSIGLALPGLHWEIPIDGCSGLRSPRALKAQGKGATETARELSIGRASVYRVL